jgi:hypothetical protein
MEVVYLTFVFAFLSETAAKTSAGAAIGATIAMVIIRQSTILAR